VLVKVALVMPCVDVAAHQGRIAVTARFRTSAAACLLLAIAMRANAATPIAAQTFDCVIEARQTVKLASSALGMVAELKVDRGDVVRKGQVVGKLDDAVEAANLELARAKAVNDYDIIGHRARLDYLTRKFDRVKDLAVPNVISQTARDEAESDMKVEQQQLRVAELQHAIARLDAQQAEAVLRQRSFVSPVNGVVVERLLSVGEYRNDQSAVMTIAEIDPLRVEVFVPTIYHGQLSIGAIGHVRPEEPVGGSHDASVIVVDRVMDAASGTFGVRLELPNPELALPAGLKCKIRFDGPARPGPNIPAPVNPPALVNPKG
jgi:RND family efflux transporter MFP subunit